MPTVGPCRTGISYACSKVLPVVACHLPGLIARFVHPGRLCRAGLVAMGDRAAPGPVSHLAPCCGFRAVCVAAQDLWGPVPRWYRDDVYRLPLGEPRAGGERLIELGGAQLLADLGYQFLLQPPQIRPGRQADPLAQALGRAFQPRRPLWVILRQRQPAYAARHSVTNGVLRAARLRSSASSSSARASSSLPRTTARMPGCTGEAARSQSPPDRSARPRASRRTALAHAVAIRVIGYQVGHGLSQSGLARVLGMHQPAIARREADDYEPSVAALAGWRECLEYHIDIRP